MAAPVLNPSFSPTLGSVLEGAANPTGITVADLIINGSITDPDGAAVEAIAIEAVNTSLGAWQYSLDSGATWLTIRADLLNSATNTLGLLLGPNHLIRLLPYGDLNGSLIDAVTFRAWDMTSGTAGDYVQTTPGVGAFSAASDTASMTVTPVNDAPTFSPALGGGKAIIPVGLGNDIGLSATVQADGKIVIAGSSAVGFYNDFSIIRLNPDGSPDTGFGAGGTAIVPVGSTMNEGRSVTVQADGKLLVAGFSDNGMDNDFSLIRLNADGSLDTSFAASGKAIVPVGPGNDYGYSVTVQANGQILVAGSSDNGLDNDFSVIRLNADGSLDASFGAGGAAIVPVGSSFDEGYSVTTQADGKILIAGNSFNGADTDFSLIRLNANGSLDTSFGAAGEVVAPVGTSFDYGYSVTLQIDGKILVAGWSDNGGDNDFSVIRLNANGNLDATFGAGGKAIIPVGASNDYGYSIKVQADGKILIAGSSFNGTDNDFSVIRLNVDGTLDASFGAGGMAIVPVGAGYDEGRSVTVQTDGKILIAGYSDNGLDTDFSVVRLNVDGSLDASFNGSSLDTLGGTVNLTQNGAVIALDASVAIFDADLAALNNGAGNYNGASVMLARRGGANSQDVFSGLGDLVLNAGAVSLLGVTIGSFTNSGGTLSILFNANATQALVNNALSSIGYSNTAATPPSRIVIDWTFSDGNTNVAQGLGGVLASTGSTRILRAGATGVILNDAELSITATSADKAEGQSGATAYTFAVTRGFNISEAHTVKWSVSGAAVNGADFVGGVLPSGVVSFAVGETSKLITVNVAGDTTVESDEAFTVTLSNPSTGATIVTASATGVIRNDDATAIIWQNSQNGDVVSWSIQDNAFKSWGFVGNTGGYSPWRIETQGNFDNTPGVDIVWKNVNDGSVYIWNTANNALGGSSYVGVVGPASGWEIVASGNFNNDPYSDLLWQNSITNDIFVWNIQNNALSASAWIGNPGANSGWQAKAVGEFDGKGNSDIVWQNKFSGDVYIWNVTDNQISDQRFVGSVGANTGWEIKDVGNFNNDSYSDILWQNSITGEVYIWDIANNAISGGGYVGSVGANSGWQIQNAGQYNSDSFSDILWHNSLTGEAYVWNITNNAAAGFASLGAPSPQWSVAPVNSPVS